MEAMQNIYVGCAVVWSRSCVLSTADGAQRSNTELPGCSWFCWCWRKRIGKTLLLLILSFSFLLDEGGQCWQGQLRLLPVLHEVFQPCRKNKHTESSYF